MGSYIAYAEPTGNYTWSDGTTSKKTINWSIVKANNTLKLSSNSGSYTYPNSGTFSVTTNVSGGDLSCSSNNSSVATCKISGTTVTVIPGTTKGTATITVTSKETANYNSSSAAHVVTTNLGTLSVTASGYNGTYNGSDHAITVTSSGATITYSSDGTNYSSTKPTYRNAGTYTTYYKVSKTGYNTVTGSRTVVINKASGSVILETTLTELVVNSTSYVGIESSTGAIKGCSSSDTSIATCSVSGDTITVVSGKNLGSTKITISVAASTNYNEASGNIDVFVKIYNNSYIHLSPANSTYTFSKNLTGTYSDQTFNLSELSLWEIESQSSTTLSITSVYASSQELCLNGLSGFDNADKTVGNLYKIYAPKSFTTSYYSPEAKATYKYGTNSSATYWTDWRETADSNYCNDIGILYFVKENGFESGDGEHDGSWLYCDDVYMGRMDYEYCHSIKPGMNLLISELNFTSGTGTKSDPYVIQYKG